MAQKKRRETYYFSHDYNARLDDKIKRLLQKHGMTGYGIYWAIIENLYNNANALRTDYDSIAYDLHSDIRLIKSVVNDFDLFDVDVDYFKSISVETRLLERETKSEKARLSAQKRWERNANAQKGDANALRQISERNALKERKEKEDKKSKPKKETRELKFTHSCNRIYQQDNILHRDELLKFIKYWTESNPREDCKLRFEMERTFDIKRRMTTWEERRQGHSNSKPPKTKYVKPGADGEFAVPPNQPDDIPATDEEIEEALKDF